MNLINKKKNKNKDIKRYFIGLILSFILIFSSFLSAKSTLKETNLLRIFIIFLLVTQILIQLIYFLNIQSISKKKWNLIALLFTILVNFIIIFGSIWIMYNLNINMSFN